MEQENVLKIARNFVLMVVVTSLVAACGGGGGSGGAIVPITNPMVQASSTPNGSNVLSTRTLKGAQGFVNPAGFTVYVFDADLADPGHSTCNSNDGCAQNWPHVSPPAGAKLSGQFSTIVRDDGSTQLMYAGRPLYTFVVDTAPGQTNGDGVDAFGGLWHIARPQGSSVSPGPTPMPTTY